MTRELIERDQKYQRLKRVILHYMSAGGETPWCDEDAWLAMVPGMTIGQYNRVVRDMLDDSEIRREYNRDAMPPLTRWVLREGREVK